MPRSIAQSAEPGLKLRERRNLFGGFAAAQCGKALPYRPPGKKPEAAPPSSKQNLEDLPR
jgi:hypothetical protein